MSLINKSEREEIVFFCNNINKAGFSINKDDYTSFVAIIINAIKEIGLYDSTQKNFYFFIKEINKEEHHEALVMSIAKLCNKHLTININKAIKKELKEEDVILSMQMRQTKTFPDVINKHYRERLLKW